MTQTPNSLRQFARMVVCVVALIQAACGGGGGESTEEVASDDIGRPLALAISSSSEVGVLTLTKVAERRVSRTVYDYDFRITLRNPGAALIGVTATVTAVGPGTSIIDGEVVVGELAAGATANPTDTITLRQDRTLLFKPSMLSWRIRSAPAVRPIVPGALLFNAPSGRAAVGQAYQGYLQLAPVDPRNRITALQLLNATPGGSAPAISLAGQLDWTPNEADFATTVLRLTATLADASKTEFNVAVKVTKVRLVASVALDGAGRYSDPDGRYVVEVAGATADSAVVGILTITERFDLTGAYTAAVSSSDPSHTVNVVTFPPGVAPSPGPQASARAGREAAQSAGDSRSAFGARSASMIGSSCSANNDNPALPCREYVLGQVIDSGVNVYTTRVDVSDPSKIDAKFPVRLVVEIDSNCRATWLRPTDCNREDLPGTPVILIHGFTAFDQIGGSPGVWGSLAAKLTANGHPVFEFRWYTGMRFEEAAGQLVLLAREVSMLTKRKPFVIGHSFGGVVTHLALAGQGITWNAGTGAWTKQSAGTKLKPLFDGVVTLIASAR